MAPHKPHDKPVKAVAESGEVLLDGPQGVALSLTPDAARKTAEALNRAADEADQHPKC
ncbi:hypothetical protein KY084_12745 [Stakelama sp. CBK3Z-3]|uniref:DUF2188 domain-containing protein n=1 Tax=Stakelama flava TaxID=2860338 RepID=A0ABS6XNF8_9SPHN|nr:hypothetical protein [Stakelama flava]MBW4331739.1 hypothetical protein [Stakelama flava]